MSQGGEAGRWVRGDTWTKGRVSPRPLRSGDPGTSLLGCALFGFSMLEFCCALTETLFLGVCLRSRTLNHVLSWPLSSVCRATFWHSPRLCELQFSPHFVHPLRSFITFALFCHVFLGKTVVSVNSHFGTLKVQPWCLLVPLLQVIDQLSQVTSLWVIRFPFRSRSDHFAVSLWCLWCELPFYLCFLDLLSANVYISIFLISGKFSAFLFFFLHIVSPSFMFS